MEKIAQRDCPVHHRAGPDAIDLSGVGAAGDVVPGQVPAADLI